METKNSCAVMHPKLLPFLDKCLLNDSLNCQGGILEIKRPKSSSLNYEDGRCCDRVTMEIPYCGTHVSWEVIFDRNHPGQPPDVIFSPKDDATDFCPRLHRLPSLSNWTLEDDYCLSNLLEELLGEYRLHHRQKVSEQQRLSFELNTLLENGDYGDVDVYCSSPSESRNAELMTRFFIPLSLDSMVIPAFLTKDNPGPDGAALIVVFPSPLAPRPFPSLLLSPRVERLLGGYGELRLPQWGGDRSVLIDYVPAVHQLLQERIELIVQSYVQRKEYTAACLSIMGRAVLEYDTEEFKTLAFFFELHGFSFITRLTLTDGFPAEQPALVLQSVYHRYQKVPCLSVVKEYPYSPRWNADEMAERLRAHLVTVAPHFMELSTEKGEFEC